MQSTTIIVLVIAVVVVTAAVVVGTRLFSEDSTTAARDAMIADMRDLAGESLKHFQKPAYLGGGGKTFKNLEKNVRKPSKVRKDKPKNQKGTVVWETARGTYYVVIADKDSTVIEGIGDVTGIDKQNPIKVQLTVKEFSHVFKVLN